jgi:hypothetical protein
MPCTGQCTLVYWKADPPVANFEAKLTKGDPALCKADNQALINWLLSDAVSAISEQTGCPKYSNDDCRPEDNCICGWDKAKEETVLTKVYPYSTTYSETITKKVGDKVVAERTCEWTISGNVTMEKHRSIAECSPNDIRPRRKKCMLVKYEGHEATVEIPPGDDWGDVIAAALSKANEG